MKIDEYIKLYLRPYKLYEKDVIHTDDYVTICKQNYSTFSNRYQQIIFCVCSELDAISTELYEKKEYKNFPNRMIEIFESIPSLRHTAVSNIRMYDTKNFVPFVKFEKDNYGNAHSADWWQEHNELKHERTQGNGSGRFNYQNANLENTLNALAALYVLNFQLAKNCGLTDTEVE